MTNSVKRTKYERAKEIGKKIGILFSALLALSSLVLFWQDQQPVLSYRIDHSKKILSVENRSLIPVSFNIYAVEYILNDSDGVINSTTPISSYYDRLFVQTDTVLWPYTIRTIDLKTADPILEFVDWNSTSSIGTNDIYYCFAIKARNFLSNSISNYTAFTSEYNFPLSGIGQRPQNSAGGGGYGAEMFYVNLESQMSASCQYEAGQYN